MEKCRCWRIVTYSSNFLHFQPYLYVICFYIFSHLHNMYFLCPFSPSVCCSRCVPADSRCRWSCGRERKWWGSWVCWKAGFRTPRACCWAPQQTWITCLLTWRYCKPPYTVEEMQIELSILTSYNPVYFAHDKYGMFLLYLLDGSWRHTVSPPEPWADCRSSADEIPRPQCHPSFRDQHPAGRGYAGSGFCRRSGTFIHTRNVKNTCTKWILVRD